MEIILRNPTIKDGLAVYNLIKSCPPLDLNSSYYYFVMCHDFCETSILTEIDGEIVGYISGYVPPQRPEIFFIWQVAVSNKARGKGLASEMLTTLVRETERAKEITTVETTISPSNKASQALFKSFSIKNRYDMSTSTFLAATDFGSAETHESEELYTIKLS